VGAATQLQASILARLNELGLEAGSTQWAPAFQAALAHAARHGQVLRFNWEEFDAQRAAAGRKPARQVAHSSQMSDAELRQHLADAHGLSVPNLSLGQSRAQLEGIHRMRSGPGQDHAHALSGGRVPNAAVKDAMAHLDVGAPHAR
jgi:hypothetical protein